jgi:hypothetical protein
LSSVPAIAGREGDFAGGWLDFALLVAVDSAAALSLANLASDS